MSSDLTKTLTFDFLADTVLGRSFKPVSYTHLTLPTRRTV